MKSVRVQQMQKLDSELGSDTRYDQVSRHLRRKADALQARRWRKLSRHMNRSPYLDSQVNQRGGIL